MGKESLFFNCLSFLSKLFLCFLLAMLYWSSLLLEEDLKLVKKNTEQITQQLAYIKNNLSPTKISSIQKISSVALPKQNLLNNLLQPDPFYENKLPSLLGENFEPKGTRKQASISQPSNLHPFNNLADIAYWNTICTVSLAGQCVGIYETLVPEMAVAMELKNENEYWIVLRQDVFWEPLHPEHFPSSMILAPHFLHSHPVTAHDFKFYYDAIMNINVEADQAVALRTYYKDIENIEVIDDFTLVVRWKTEEVSDEKGQITKKIKYAAKSLTGELRPLASFVYQYFSDGNKIIQESDTVNYQNSAIWAQNFTQHWAKNIIVSCGGWLFDGMTEREIHFRRNPNYFDPLTVLVERLEIKFKNSPDSIWEEFKAGNIDSMQITPNQITELENFLISDFYKEQISTNKGLQIKKLEYTDRMYSYVGWNEAHLLFSNKKIRQALTLAIDRERIIRQNLNGHGIQTTGTFFPYSTSYDPSIIPYPFDPEKAKEILKEEGWIDTDGDGIIDKLIEGKQIPFRFSLTYYVKNPIAKAICEYITTALKEIGILCQLNGVDVADLSKDFANKNFDAIYFAWSLVPPPEDPRQLWHSSGAKEIGSSNAIGFVNKEVDQIIDQLNYTYDAKTRRDLYYKFDAIIHEEAPYLFLYVPQAIFVYRNYLQNLFIPVDRQDLIPGANVGEPQPQLFWIRSFKEE